MFGLFKKGFSFADLPALLKQVEDEWDKHTAELKERFDNQEARIKLLEEKLGISEPQQIAPPEPTQEKPLTPEEANAIGQQTAVNAVNGNIPGGTQNA